MTDEPEYLIRKTSHDDGDRYLVEHAFIGLRVEAVHFTHEEWTRNGWEGEPKPTACVTFLGAEIDTGDTVGSLPMLADVRCLAMLAKAARQCATNLGADAAFIAAYDQIEATYKEGKRD